MTILPFKRTTWYYICEVHGYFEYFSEGKEIKKLIKGKWENTIVCPNRRERFIPCSALSCFNRNIESKVIEIKKHAMLLKTGTGLDTTFEVI